MDRVREGLSRTRRLLQATFGVDGRFSIDPIHAAMILAIAPPGNVMDVRLRREHARAEQDTRRLR